MLVIVNGAVRCPECSVDIKVGTGGLANFRQRHLGKEKCKENQRKRDEQAQKAAQLERTQAMFASFRRKPPEPVPPTIPEPPVVKPPHLPAMLAPEPEPAPINTPPPKLLPAIPCQHATDLIEMLRKRIKSLPESVPVAQPNHPFSQFSGDLTGTVPKGEDAWEIWNGPLDTALQKGPAELQGLVAQGEYGLDALCNIFDYLARYHQVGGALFEGKIERVIRAINDM